MSEELAVRALRGATTVDAGNGGDARDQARVAIQELLRELLHRNGATCAEVISAQFTVTADLPDAAPALAAREAGWHDVPMLAALESPAGDRLLPHCVRVLLHLETRRPRSAMRHVYLRGAAELRPDLADSMANQ